MIEHRQNLRVKLPPNHQTATIDIMGSTNALGETHKLTNISRTGMFFVPEHATTLDPGKSFHFALDLGEYNDLRGVGVVRWVRETAAGADVPRGYGIEVLEFHDSADRNFYDYIEKCLESMCIGDLMQHRFQSVYPDTSMKSALEIMNQYGCDVLLVTNSRDAPVGILTAKNIALACGKANFMTSPISDFMTSRPDSVAPDQGFSSSASFLQNRSYDHVPVVDDGILVGLLGIRDALPFWTEFQELKAKRLEMTYERAVSVMAHDLRSQIAVVKTSNTLLTSGELTAEDYINSGLPEIIDKNCDLVLQLVDDILDSERVKLGSVRLNRKLIDIEDVIDRVIKCYGPAADAKNIHIEIDIPTAVPKIKADPIRIEQALNNLVSNAVKFCKENASVVIGVKAHHSRIAIWIADSGPGIPQSEIENLFKEYPSISVKPTAGEKSHGLGLTIVKKLVEAHHGSIRVESNPGDGTTFTVFLPIGIIQ